MATNVIVTAEDDLRTVNSTLAPIQWLPPELLDIILEICVHSGRRSLARLFATRDAFNSSVDLRSKKSIGAYQALLLSHVCSEWRGRLLSNPAFWSLIPVSLFPVSLPRVFLLAIFLTRSQSHPLDLVIYDSPAPEDLKGLWSDIQATLAHPHTITGLLYHAAPRWRTVFATWLLFWDLPFLQNYHFPLLEQLFLTPFLAPYVEGAPELSTHNITTWLDAPQLCSLSVPWVSFDKTLYLTAIHTAAAGPSDFLRVVLDRQNDGQLDQLTSLSVSGVLSWHILLQPVRLPALEHWATPIFSDRFFNKPRLRDLSITTLPGLKSLADHISLSNAPMNLRVLSLKVDQYDDTIQRVRTILDRLPTLESLEFGWQLGPERNRISDLIPLFYAVAFPSSPHSLGTAMPRLQSFRLFVDQTAPIKINDKFPLSVTAVDWDAFQRSLQAFVQPSVPRSLFRTLYVNFGASDMVSVEMNEGVREHIRESMAGFSEQSGGQVQVFISYGLYD